jgi:signal-transduction protein with cAMP-binding, CBS, and nucleotidyltransferase domain
MIMEKNQHLNVLLPTQMDKVVNSVVVDAYEKGDVVIEAGTEIKTTLFLIVKGSVTGIDGFEAIGDDTFFYK